MKNSMLLKNLIEFLFSLMVFMIIIVFGITLFSKSFDFGLQGMQDYTFTEWLIIAVAMSSNIILLFGLSKLRKVALAYLSDQQFSSAISHNMILAGRLFIWASVLTVIGYVASWIHGLLLNELTLSFFSGTVHPIFVIIIGLVLIIQGRSINIARDYQEENALTI